jgi:hypothetical protein
MSKFISRLGGVAAAAALVLSVTAGSAAANVTRYHESTGTVTIATPSTVTTTVGSRTVFPVTVSMAGSGVVKIVTEKFLTVYGSGDSQWEGLSFAKYGCWARSLEPGQSCTSLVAFTPTTVGSHVERYMIDTTFGTLVGRFTTNALRCGPTCQIGRPVNSGSLAQ